MDYSHLDRVKFIFKYNDGIFHNFFLTLLLVVFIFCIISLLRNVRQKKKNLPNLKNKLTVILMIPCFFFQLILYAIISFALMGASSVEVIDQLVVGEDFYSLQNIHSARSTGTVNRVRTSTYISKISLSNPKDNWKKKIHEGTNRTTGFLGETTSSIYYQSAKELEGIDKKTGEKNLTSDGLIEQNPQLENTLSLDRNKYRLSAEENLLSFETNIGDQYQLDLESLRVKKLPESSIDFNDHSNSAIKKRMPAGNMDKSLAFTTTLSSNDSRFPFVSFLSDEIIKKAGEVKEFSVVGPDFDMMDSFNRTPKYLYGFGYSDETSQLSFTKVSKQKWIDPKFIMVHSSDQQTNVYSITDGVTQMDAIDKTSKQIITVPHDDFFGSMAESFAMSLLELKVPTTPLLINDKELFIVHAETVESNSNLLLSLWDTQKNNTKWTVKMNSTSLEYYSLSGSSLIVTVNTNQGSSQLFILDTKTGLGKGYDFKYNDIFEVTKF